MISPHLLGIRSLARRVGPAGTVVGIDVGEPYLAIARSEAVALGNVRYLRADAQTFPFQPEFDVCYSRFGVTFFDDRRFHCDGVDAGLARVNDGNAGTVWPDRSLKFVRGACTHFVSHDVSDPEVSLRELFGDRLTVKRRGAERLPNTANVNFAGQVGAVVLARLSGVAASTGSACHAGSVELSPVLAGMRVPPQEGMGAVRFSLGRTTTWEELEHVLAKLGAAAAGGRIG